MDVNGSPEFALTWKDWDMPAGGPICALRASERRTGDKGCSGWPTPTCPVVTNGHEAGNNRFVTKTCDLVGWPTCNACDWKDSPGMRETGVNPDGTERKRLDMLPRVAQLAAWPTPRTPTGGPETAERKQELGRTESGGGDLAAVANLAAWPTPSANKNTKNSRDPQRMKEGGRQTCLADAAHLAGWATPRAEDAESAGMRHSRGVADTLTAQAGQGLPLAGWGTPRVTTNGGHGSPDRATDGMARLEDQAHGVLSTYCPAGTGKRGVLRPGHSRWLMGYPVAWDSCGATAMQSCRKSRRSS